MTAAALLSIGELAREAGTTVSTVRYYDRIGVISSSTRVGGKRRFSPETVGRLNFIRRSREAGFSLDEVRAILDDTSGDWHTVVAGKVNELSERRSELDAMIAMLTEMQTCGCQVVAECPRFEPCS